MDDDIPDGSVLLSVISNVSTADMLDRRDPPSLISSSELRDLSLQPSAVIHTKGITIIHQQLRDLILPLERARVIYPHGTTLEQITWSHPADENDKDPQQAVSLTVQKPFSSC